VPEWNREDLAWLAGLFEGEGCITHRGDNREHYVLRLAMTDPDVVRRAYHIAGLGRLYYKPPNQPGHKDQLLWVVYPDGHVYALLVALWPWLGERRRRKAEEAITAFRDRVRRNLNDYQREQIVKDWRATGDSAAKVASRHGVSRSLAQMLIQPHRLPTM
jgi:hypothetical protein